MPKQAKTSNSDPKNLAKAARPRKDGKPKQLDDLEVTADNDLRGGGLLGSA